MDGANPSRPGQSKEVNECPEITLVRLPSRFPGRGWGGFFLFAGAELDFGVPEFHHAPVEAILDWEGDETAALHFFFVLAPYPQSGGAPGRAGVGVDEHGVFDFVIAVEAEAG